jgi:hypothetical protein
MKNIVLLISDLLVFSFVFPQKAKEFLLERSKKQKRTARILLDTDTAAIITGANIMDTSTSYHFGRY